MCKAVVVFMREGVRGTLTLEYPNTDMEEALRLAQGFANTLTNARIEAIAVKRVQGDDRARVRDQAGAHMAQVRAIG